jgi:hypothetical protein
MVYFTSGGQLDLQSKGQGKGRFLRFRSPPYSATRGREGARGRGLVAYLAKTVSDYKVKEIASHFKRSPVTTGEAIIKVEDLQRKDKTFGKTLTRIRENLVKGRKRKYRISVA